MRVPLMTWLWLLATHLQRYYYALLTTYGWLRIVIYCVALYLTHSLLLHSFFKLSASALSIYLMRPTLMLKNRLYMRDYDMLEAITVRLSLLSLGTILIFFLPTWLTGIAVIMMLSVFSFAFDAVGSIPDKVGYALLRASYFMLYNAPVVMGLGAVAAVAEYCPWPIMHIILVYPLFAAMLTILYVSAVHENYELYYAE